jgi:hypothetical protein
MINKCTLLTFLFYSGFTCLAMIALAVILISGPWTMEDPWMIYLMHCNLEVVTWGIFMICAIGTLLLKRRARAVERP